MIGYVEAKERICHPERNKTDLPEKASIRNWRALGERGKIESEALFALTASLKYGEDEFIGEGVQAIGDEDTEAYIR